MLRRLAAWLYPGLGIKRWMLLAFAGVVVLLYSAMVLVGVLWSPQLLRGLGLGWLQGHSYGGTLLAIDGMVVGAAAALWGARRALLFERRGETAAEIREAARLARGPWVVAVGGGHGLEALLRGLKASTSNLTAVVTMADDGGSSGLLRRGLGLPPPGDLRNCLVALADDESMMSRLFRYRFPEAGGLQGHSFGNLFMAALAEVTGDFELAVRESTHVLRVRGRVFPSTLDDVVLHAQLEGGGRVSGESTIAATEGVPRNVWLTPPRPRALPEAVAAIRDADLIVLGPGSLFTSIIPNLLVPEIKDAIAGSRGCVVYVCNVMTQTGETDAYTAADHLEALHNHGVAGLVDIVLVNDAPVSAELQAAYRRLGAVPVVVDAERLDRLGVRVVRGEIVAESDVVRHDPRLLAEMLLSFVR